MTNRSSIVLHQNGKMYSNQLVFGCWAKLTYYWVRHYAQCTLLLVVGVLLKPFTIKFKKN